MTFAEFVASDLRRMTIAERSGLRIYTRRSVYIDGFDLATIESARPGRGVFTRFLNKWEPRVSLRVEMVLNDRLAEFLKRRGYEADGWGNYIKAHQC